MKSGLIISPSHCAARVPPARQAPQSSYRAVNPGPGRDQEILRADFGSVAVNRRAADAGADGRIATSDSCAGRAQAPAPAPAPAPATPAAPAAPSLSLSNDSYTDSGSTSHKVIKFNVAVPAGLTAADYCLVNKLQGHMKKADGTYWKVRMYGSSVDFNFSSEQVDSVDADPVYWSDASARRNYTTESGGFSATDDPGPPSHAFAARSEAKVKFKIGLYRLADVPTTTTGSLSASPIRELPWQYSVVAAADGSLSHPVL